ncbi:MAG: TrbC/VirB2 family protein [Treponema sp.]|jgi:type IV secretory pathway VirB2 component (pilin)|nr:TrbC/VirB2 family protein [Treponema sp.]
MYKRALLLCVLLLALASAVSASGGETMPWDDVLTRIQKSLGGRTAMTIGIILVIGGGIALAVTEGQALKKLFWVIIGLGIALNAMTLVNTLFGAGAGLLW